MCIRDRLDTTSIDWYTIAISTNRERKQLIHLFISDTGQAHFVATHDETLSALQTMVDGLIEYHPCVKALQGLDCWVNEEAGFRPEFFTNYVASYETNLPLRGSAVLSRSNEQGETVGLTDDDIKTIENLMDISEHVEDVEFIQGLHSKRKEEYREANVLR